jgi:hypothetical protein
MKKWVALAFKETKAQASLASLVLSEQLTNFLQ